MHLTKKVAEFIANADYADIPEPALRQAKTSISDWFFVSLAGQHQAGSLVRNLKELQPGASLDANSSIVGSKTKVSENQAALINGCIGHVMDYDETCPKVRSHLFASIFPAVLAVAEHSAASGKQMLESFIVGHEVGMRIGEAITPNWIRAGWHGTSLFGIFGAVAGCAKLMRLDADRIRCALGLAASMASGVAVNFGSMAKPLHAGMAAERGLFASQLARCGFTANQNALEGALGFYHAYNWGQPADHAVFDSLGDPWGLETPGISAIKLYPCCHGLATNIECGIRIHDQHAFKLEDIESIEIHSQPKTLCAMLSRNYEDNGEGLKWGHQGPPRQMRTILPATGSQAKFSKEYAFARALKDGAVMMEHLTDEAVNDPEIRPWMAKIKIYHNSELEKYADQYPEETAPHAERMIVRLKNGKMVTEQEIFIRGMTRRPLAFEDVQFKYRECGRVAGLSTGDIERLMDRVNGLEKLESIDELMQLINH